MLKYAPFQDIEESSKDGKVSKKMLKIVDPTGWSNIVMGSPTTSCEIGATIPDEDELPVNVLPVQDCCKQRLRCRDAKMPV